MAGQGKPELNDVAQRLLGDLRRIRFLAVEVKDRAMGDLATLNERRAAHLEGVVLRTMDRLGALHPEVSLQLSTPVSPGLRVLVAGGEATLERMLFNLVGNACESQARTVDIRVDLDREDRVRVHINDDGPGFPRAVLSGQTSSTKAGGTGVGLSVVRGLTEASGGFFWFGNRERGGRAVLTLLRAPGDPR